MAYWWVSQNKTYAEERAGGYLWAPVRDKAGRTPRHWATMTEIRPGDVIFSYVGQQIRAVSVAINAAEEIAQPAELATTNLWEREGRLVRASYTDLPHRLSIPRIVRELLPLLPAMYGPLNRSGTGNQGYLFAVPARAGELLLERIGMQELGTEPDPLVAAIQRAPLPETEKQALVKSRIGQGQFRADLFALWSGCCAVSGLTVPELLRASHIKPWRDSNHQERLEPYNGLLLAPAYDAAFDSGLITFKDDGHIHISPQLSAPAVQQLGIDPRSRIVGIRPEHLAFLRHHRQEVFRNAPDADLPRVAVAAGA
jgi:putative restriction endonuclease